MSHGSGEEENYWPGYVDALTSMVQVLAFVMMLLAMAVFVLSQNVSKSAVESIAKAAKLNPPADATVSQLTAMVIEALEKAQASKAPAPAPDAAPTPDAEIMPDDGASASKSNAAPTPAATPKPAPTPAATAETAQPSEQAQASADAPSAAPPAGKRDLQTRAVNDTDVPPDAKSVVLHFEGRSFTVDQFSTKDLEKLLTDAQTVEKGGQITLRAYASSADGALSEARHLAYYRAMSVRTQLLAHKVLPGKIKIKVIDVSDKSRGSTVELFSE